MRINFVKTGRLAVVLAGTAFAAAFATTGARAEIVGQLQCNIAAGNGNLIVSDRPVSCTFRSQTAPLQFYTGDISRLGLDIGQLNGGRLVYDVLSIGTPAPGALQGNYIGAGFGITLGTGIGVNALVGGNANSFTLQPLATTTSTGTNISAGLASLKLNFVGLERPPLRRRHRGLVARY